MFSSLASYIWGSATEEEVQSSAQEAPQATDTLHRSPSPASKLKTRPAENEWVLVETSSCEGSPGHPAGSRACAPHPAPHPESEETPSMDCGNCDPLTPNPSSDSPVSSSGRRRHSPPDVMHSSQSDTCSDVSTLPDIPGTEESWLVTPPPCFTAGARSPGLSALETSSMENLLIEHPSMSVYAARGRQNSEGVESNHSDSEEDQEVVLPPVAARGQTASVRHPPRRAHAIAQRAGLTTSHKRALQHYKTRSMTRAALHRQNLVHEVAGRTKQLARRGRIVQPCAHGQRRC